MVLISQMVNLKKDLFKECVIIRRRKKHLKKVKGSHLSDIKKGGGVCAPKRGV